MKLVELNRISATMSQFQFELNNLLYNTLEFNDWELEVKILPGDILNDRYVIQEKIGSGHFSTVWLAIDSLSQTLNNHGQLVALKIPKYSRRYGHSQDEIKLLTAATLLNNKQEIDKNEKNNTREHHVVKMLDSFTMQVERDFCMFLFIFYLYLLVSFILT